MEKEFLARASTVFLKRAVQLALNEAGVVIILVFCICTTRFKNPGGSCKALLFQKVDCGIYHLTSITYLAKKIMEKESQSGHCNREDKSNSSSPKQSPKIPGTTRFFHVKLYVHCSDGFSSNTKSCSLPFWNLCSYRKIPNREEHDCVLVLNKGSKPVRNMTAYWN